MIFSSGLWDLSASAALVLEFGQRQSLTQGTLGEGWLGSITAVRTFVVGSGVSSHS